jgi:hypothetical protein
MITIFAKTSSSWSKNGNTFAKFFGENILHRSRTKCYDFKNIFAEKFGDFDSNYSCIGRRNDQNLFFFRKKRHFFAENR